jgi:hypothetical protein
VGVFREQIKADRAVEEQTPENTRIIVSVNADGRDKQAFGILFSSGANNADLPPGMSLEETVDIIPKPELEGSFSKDSYFAEEKDLGTSEQLGQMDKL